jgi:hypothetical protein
MSNISHLFLWLNPFHSNRAKKRSSYCTGYDCTPVGVDRKPVKGSYGLGGWQAKRVERALAFGGECVIMQANRGVAQLG